MSLLKTELHKADIPLKRKVAISLLNEGFIVKLKVEGSSMFPFLRENDIIYLKKANTEELQTGTIIVFEQNNGWVAHRIYSVKKKKDDFKIECRGDSRLAKDPIIGIEALVGIVVAYERNGRKVDLTTPWSRIRNRWIALLSPVFSRLFSRLK